jgi:queuosine precursor transporter
MINTLFDAFLIKPYKVCGYELTDADRTVVKYTLRNKRAGTIYRKSARDVLLDQRLRKNFDDDDLIEIASIVQSENLQKHGRIDSELLGTFQRANKPLYAFYPYLVGLTVVVWCFCALFGHRFLATQIFGTRLILPGGIAIFPIIYFMADLIQEVYGYSRLRQTLWICIFCHVSIGLLTSIVMIFPPAPFVDAHAYDLVLNQQWRMIVGNILGMIVGFTLNGILMAKLKIKFEGKNLWLRTIVSTFFAELFYSYVCAFIAFHENLAIMELVKLQFSMVIIKALWEVVATPFLYVASAVLKRREGVDIFDYYTNFNPFSFSL